MTPEQEYIQHHLHHWSVGRGFLALHLDSLLVSVTLGTLLLLFFYVIARRGTAAVPGRLQCAVEFVVEWVEDLVQSALSKRDPVLGAFALMLLSWLTLINAVDFIPVDFIPCFMSLFGCQHFRAVPSADLNVTLGMATGVLLMMIGYSMRSQGVLGWFHQISLIPIPHWLFFGFNVLLESVSLLSKTFSLAIRLFANMYAGELVFILAAAICPWGLHWLPFGLWATFHLLVVVLQAIIFTTLSINYIATSAEAH